MGEGSDTRPSAMADNVAASRAMRLIERNPPRARPGPGRTLAHSKKSATHRHRTVSSRTAARARGVDLSIVQEETRETGRDETIARGDVTAWITPERDDYDAATARKTARAAGT